MNKKLFIPILLAALCAAILVGMGIIDITPKTENKQQSTPIIEK